MSTKVLVSDDVSESALDVLRAESALQVVYLPGKAGANVAEEIRDAAGLVVRSATKVNARLLEAAANLRVIGRAGVGVDNVDLDAATRKGIVVMNTPGGNATSVAEVTFAFMLSLVRRLPQADSSMKAGKWEKKKFLGLELRGKTLGIVGFGRIGMEVARLAQAFQMSALTFDPYISASVAAGVNVRRVSLEELLQSSDFITLHCSATPDTIGMINAKTLALTKPGVRIINCARGELIDEAALLAALESGHVAGAGLDVFQKEPPAGSALVSHANVIATPHIAGSTEEAQEIVGIRIAEQVRDYLLQGVARNAVNMPAISTEEYQRLEPYIQLGERLGSFLAQISSGAPQELRLSYDGGLSELNTHLVRNAVLQGALNQVLSEPHANLINASTLAKERGIEVMEQRSARRAEFSNSLGLALKTDKETCSVLGMVGMRGGLRVLGVNDVDVEATLRGVMIFIRNQDVPGVIGRIGTLLGARSINIASFALGRYADTREALGLINVDDDVPAAVLEEIRSIPAVRHAQVVKVAGLERPVAAAG
jgi:D-3-phosphoglycerate dehydrogenase